MHAGAPVAAEKLIGLDIELAIAGFSQLAATDRRGPVMHAAVAARHSRHAIDVGDFEFISHNSQINAVHVFMESLPFTLTR
jgi:hypothetical protein